MAYGPYTFYLPPVRMENIVGLAGHHILYPASYTPNKWMDGLWLPGPSGVTGSAIPAQFTIRSYDMAAASKYEGAWTSFIGINPPHVSVYGAPGLEFFIKSLDDCENATEAAYQVAQMIAVRYAWLLTWYKLSAMIRDAFKLTPSRGGTVRDPDP